MILINFPSFVAIKFVSTVFFGCSTMLVSTLLIWDLAIYCIVMGNICLHISSGSKRAHLFSYFFVVPSVSLLLLQNS